ncbi:hypothetical protein HanXRQr2_Chr11g0514581 [Helianthus annuus]|uniref:Uncharacterized protein n=1 Tax=Helianthus annuus TaxID=4232 RepID=A0A9K3N209_HELAN|nr:hypothetical protein HanXRQr2_Chr11g0514581 [Helianthus annuus]KAJ0877072.1 hypothetical protein HanPSC8_Chr11g0495901 [Helianthus annuus]
MAKVLTVLSQILKIFELTTPRVGLARPRVSCQFCLLQLSFLLHSIHLRTRPHVKSSVLAILWFECESRLSELRQFLLLYICVGFCCLFAPFAHLSSFNPEN